MIEDRMNKLHAFRVITMGDADGNGASEKTIFTAAMGPFSSGESTVDAPQPETLLTVAEQDKARKAGKVVTK